MVIVISGPGGVGKGTVVRLLVDADPLLWLSRSWTTRTPRQGEDADAYHFSSRREFEEAAAAGRFLEWAEFQGNLYGTPCPSPDHVLDVVLEIDTQGAEQILGHVPDAHLVFLDAPDRHTQAVRLRGRGDPEDQVEARVAEAEMEVARAHRLGARILVNDDLQDTVRILQTWIAEWRRQD